MPSGDRDAASFTSAFFSPSAPNFQLIFLEVGSLSSSGRQDIFHRKNEGRSSRICSQDEREGGLKPPLFFLTVLLVRLCVLSIRGSGCGDYFPPLIIILFSAAPGSKPHSLSSRIPCTSRRLKGNICLLKRREVSVYSVCPVTCVFATRVRVRKRAGNLFAEVIISSSSPSPPSPVCSPTLFPGIRSRSSIIRTDDSTRRGDEGTPFSQIREESKGLSQPVHRLLS